MTFGSVCSGIEAASVAWEPIGFKAAWLSEIDQFPSAVLAHHYPHVQNMGDMTRLVPLIASGEIDAPDVFVGGTPCQAFSVAGLRGGLDEPRTPDGYARIAGDIPPTLNVMSGGQRQHCVFGEWPARVASSLNAHFGEKMGIENQHINEGAPLFVPVCFNASSINCTDRHGVSTATHVRRLTPTEFERLQGFPDGYTQIPWRKKQKEECPDGNRYKVIGNSMAVPVMRWIGRRIINRVTI